jgi:hypothetical protein
MKTLFFLSASMAFVLTTGGVCFGQRHAQTNLVSSAAGVAVSPLEIGQASLESPRPTHEIHAHIRSTPAGAYVLVDGDYVGTTPLDIDLSCCFHDVTISKPGRKPWTGTVRNNGHANINAHLRK